MLVAGPLASAAELRLGQAAAWSGAGITLPLTCSNAPGTVAAQVDLSFDPAAVSLTGIAAGNALAGHVLDQQELAPGHWRALVYSPTNGALVSSSLLWVTFTLPANALDGVVPIVVSNGILSAVAGQRVQPLAQVSGALIVSSKEIIESVTRLAGGQLRMDISGPPGRVFTLQGPPDLFHWANLNRYTNASGDLAVTNTPPPGRNEYFYRTAHWSGCNPPAVSAPNLTGTARLPDGRTRFQLNATTGSAWRIEGSPDLRHWGNYGVVTNQSGALQITNTPVKNPKVYFYRAAQP